MRSRAQRIHHAERWKRRVARYVTCEFAQEEPAPRRWKIIGLRAKTPAACSCWMCGNPRRYDGERTRQEVMADLRMNEQLHDA